MNYPPSQRRRRSPNASPSPVVFPNDLIVEVLSLLAVKSVMRMRCVSKYCNSLYTDPIFVKLHFSRSPHEPHLALVTFNPPEVRLVPFPASNLLENPQITLADDPCYVINNYLYPFELIHHEVVGSCNGLICILSYSKMDSFFRLSFWNPSTRVMSKQLGFNFGLFGDKFNVPTSFKFSFGYDNSTNSYKVVVLKFHSDEVTKVETTVFSLRDNIWRKIQNFPAVPCQMIKFRHQMNGSVYLNGTLNWLAFDFKFTYVEVIISLDLGTETYMQIRVPPRFDKKPYVDPTISVLMNCLCFSYHFKRTHFVIWRMMEFGHEESWTQFLNISYDSINIDDSFMRLKFYLMPLVPLYLSENGDTLMLATSLEEQAILYNIRDNNAVRTRITNNIYWFSVKNYVQSLASIC